MDLLNIHTELMNYEHFVGSFHANNQRRKEKAVNECCNLFFLSPYLTL